MYKIRILVTLVNQADHSKDDQDEHLSLLISIGVTPANAKPKIYQQVNWDSLCSDIPTVLENRDGRNDNGLRSKVHEPEFAPSEKTHQHSAASRNRPSDPMLVPVDALRIPE